MILKTKYIFYAGAFIFFTILGIITFPKNNEIEIQKDSQNEDVPETIFVHIDGEVNNPGIKEVEKYTRIFELIELAGGLTENADISHINLASVLKDEQKIIIPQIIVQDVSNSAPSHEKVLNSYSNSDVININFASKEELMKLSGIGDSMASKIINYREEFGLFNSIEDIKNVSGIGDSKFNKIKDYITTY